MATTQLKTNISTQVTRVTVEFTTALLNLQALFKHMYKESEVSSKW